MDIRSKISNQLIAISKKLGYRLPDIEQQISDNLSLISGPLINFTPSSFCITTQTIGADDCIKDAQGNLLEGEVIMEYNEETNIVEFFFLSWNGIKTFLFSYQYSIDGRIVKDLPAENIINFCEKLKQYVSYSKDTDPDNLAFDKCGNINSKFISLATIIDDKCKFKALLDKKSILDILTSSKLCNGVSPFIVTEKKDKCGSTDYIINFNSCRLDGLVNVNIDNESITNTKVFPNPKLGGGIRDCSSTDNECSPNRILQANLTIGCGIEKIKRSSGEDMPNSAKVKLSDKQYNATICDTSDNSIITPIDEETIRKLPDKKIFAYTYANQDVIIGTGTKNDPLNLNKCGRITNEYLKLRTTDYNKAWRFGTNEMGLEQPDALRQLFFNRIITTSFPRNDCNEFLRGFLTMRGGTDLNLCSHKVSIEFGIIPITGMKRMIEYLLPNSFEDMCFGGIDIPFENANGSWQSGSFHTQYGGNNISGQSLIHNANDCVLIKPNEEIKFKVYCKIQAPNNMSIKDVKVAVFAENGGLSLTRWVQSIDVGLFTDFKVF